MKNIITIILFLSINHAILPQFQDDFDKFRNLKTTKYQDKNYDFARESGNEIEFIFSNLFLFYKNFISSQDVPSCTFTPSCSEYAILSIKKQGTIKGLINFFDRFARCNGLSPEHYAIDREHKVLIDPPRDIHYELLE